MLLVPTGLTGVTLDDGSQKRLWALRKITSALQGRIVCVIPFWLGFML